MDPTHILYLVTIEGIGSEIGSEKELKWCFSKKNSAQLGMGASRCVCKVWNAQDSTRESSQVIRGDKRDSFSCACPTHSRKHSPIFLFYSIPFSTIFFPIGYWLLFLQQ